MNYRSGTILIIAAGISSLMAILALVFLTRMQSDSLEAELLVNETRARVMFTSALQYIAESSRIGWDDPATPEHEEAFGWIDVRTGQPGPIDQRGNSLNHDPTVDPVTGIGKKWPSIGSHMICNARLWKRPPTATSFRVAPNPIIHDPTKDWGALVNYKNLDPLPAVQDKTDFNAFLQGDSTVEPWTDAPCWFRVYRKKPAVFIVTCGGGSSRGYRDWNEVKSSPDNMLWSAQTEWEMTRYNEPIMWYEVEWSPTVNTNAPGFIYMGVQTIRPGEISRPHTWFKGMGHDFINEDMPAKVNQMGTFLYRQRLEKEPKNW